MNIVNDMLLVLCLYFVMECEVGADSSDSDFAKIFNSKTFIDKTLIVKDFVRFDPAIKVVTAPSGYGKSSAIDVLKRFLGIQVDENGVPRFLENNTNYQLFANKTLIFYSSYFVSFGQYPVVHIDLKPLREVTDLETLRQHLETVIAKTFKEHAYLKHNSTLFNKVIPKELFNNYCDVASLKHLSSKEIQKAFQWLTVLLHKHFDRTVVVLVDEYDSFCNSLLFNNITRTVADDIINYLTEITKLLFVNSRYIHKAFLTGTLQVKYINIDPEFISYYRFLGYHVFSQYFGFFDVEVVDLIKRLISNDDQRQDALNMLEKWYSGFWIRKRNSRHYNMLSVVEYFRGKMEPKSYWIRSQPMKKTLNFGPAIHDLVMDIFPRLLSSPVVYANIAASLSFNLDAVNTLKSPNNESLGNNTLDWFYAYIYDLGYLSISRTHSSKQLSRREELVPLEIPKNHEIRSEYRAFLSSCYRRRYYRYLNSDAERLHDAFNMFLPETNFTEACEGFYKTLNDLFRLKYRPPTEKDLRQIVSYLVSKKWPYGERLATQLPMNVTNTTVDNLPYSLKDRADMFLYYKTYGQTASMGIKNMIASKTLDLLFVNDRGVEIVVATRFQETIPEELSTLLDEMSKFSMLQILWTHDTILKENTAAADLTRNATGRLFMTLVFEKKKKNLSIGFYNPSFVNQTKFMNCVKKTQKELERPWLFWTTRTTRKPKKIS